MDPKVPYHWVDNDVNGVQYLRKNVACGLLMRLSYRGP
jgi:hypothetical protein